MVVVGPLAVFPGGEDRPGTRFLFLCRCGLFFLSFFLCLGASQTSLVVVIPVVPRQNAHEVADGAEDDEAVEDLVRGSPVVKGARLPAFRESSLESSRQQGNKVRRTAKGPYREE
jgi:hypothetical protein